MVKILNSLIKIFPPHQISSYLTKGVLLQEITLVLKTNSVFIYLKHPKMLQEARDKMIKNYNLNQLKAFLCQKILALESKVHLRCLCLASFKICMILFINSSTISNIKIRFKVIQVIEAQLSLCIIITNKS